MAYQEFSTPPAYVAPVWDHGKVMNPDAVKWSHAEPPPPIGARIVVTMNKCGPAVVTGYFVEDGWLGLRCDLTDPPEWHVKQNKGNPAGCVFGPEFKLAEGA
jgi:hypothetical protein